MTYEKLLLEADSEGITTKEKSLKSADGRIKGKKIAIRINMPITQKTCTMAEELGHYHTTVGNIINLSSVVNQKQEDKARLWSYNRLIGLNGIIRGYQARCQNRYELAQYLDVTEEFLQDAIDCYRSKYGLMVEVDNYIIYFDPQLAVMERF